MEDDTTLVTLDQLQRELSHKPLPGGTVTVEVYENAIATHALRGKVDDGDLAHPIWFIISSLRGMGITVDALCRLAHAGPRDTLLYGEVSVEQELSLQVGASYSVEAGITEVGRSAMRDGSVLDKVTILVELIRDGVRHGTVSSTYLFKRSQS